MERLNTEAFYQCVECGHIHRARVDKVIDLLNGLHYATYCAKCKDVTKQLWVGNTEDEKYLYYDPVLDKKMY